MATEITRKHAQARALAEAGWPIFPCDPNDKTPAFGVHWKEEATTDLAVIDGWWARADCNIGFSPGMIGLACVDTDMKHGIDGEQNYQALEGEKPATYRHRTPGGGFHRLFVGSFRPSVSKIAPGIDTRGDDSYILLPPSSINGVEYEVVDDIEPAPAPVWIGERVNRRDTRLRASGEVEYDDPHARARGLDHLRRLVKLGDTPRLGGRNDRAYRLAAELLDLGLSEGVAFGLMAEEWNPHGDPPLDTGELATVVANAAAFKQNDDGVWAPGAMAEVFKEALDRLPKDETPSPRSRFHFADEAEMDNAPEPTWLVPNLIPDRQTVLWTGQTQAFKSFLLLDVALAVSAGKPTFGVVPVRSGPVIYAALEGALSLKKSRRPAWKIVRGVEAVPDFYVGPGPIIGMPGEIQEFGDAIAKLLHGKKPALIVLDTLSKMMAGLNENDAGDAGRLIRFADSLVEAFDCSVVIVHHLGKDTSRGARGSSAFHAGFDSVIEVKAHNGVRAVEVWVRKHKDAEEPETPFTLQGHKVAGSLVFDPTTPAQHRELTGSDDLYDRKKVGAALKQLGAVGAAKWIATSVLGHELLPAMEGETPDEHEARVGRGVKVLGSLSRTKLEAYCQREGREVRWFLPE